MQALVAPVMHEPDTVTISMHGRLTEGSQWTTTIAFLLWAACYSVLGGRLECTMQNIADNFSNTYASRHYRVKEGLIFLINVCPSFLPAYFCILTPCFPF